MVSYSYVGAVNPNLICCICRLPFVDPTVTKTCSHTFCLDCITRSISISPYCPVDRSALRPDGLQPANPIVRHLVDELLVLCPLEGQGCSHVCERQLLRAHIRESCLYGEVKCSAQDCRKALLRKDIPPQESGEGAAHEKFKCSACRYTESSDGPEAENCRDDDNTQDTQVCTTFNHDERPEAVWEPASRPNEAVRCTRGHQGCTWTGSPSSLELHKSSCPYESIKEFLDDNARKMLSMSEENLLLRNKVEELQYSLRCIQRDLTTANLSIGPWVLANNGWQTETSPSPALPEQGASIEQATEHSQLLNGSNRMSPGLVPPPPHRIPAPGGSNVGDGSPFLANRGQQRQATPFDSFEMFSAAFPSTVPPLDLSSSVYGSLLSLRDSVVNVSEGLGSLARRQAIALNAETSRINEEMCSLRLVIQGIRLQLHSLMMDRNSQMTGQSGDPAFGRTVMSTHHGIADVSSGFGVPRYMPWPASHPIQPGTKL